MIRKPLRDSVSQSVPSRWKGPCCLYEQKFSYWKYTTLPLPHSSSQFPLLGNSEHWSEQGKNRKLVLNSGKANIWGNIFLLSFTIFTLLLFYSKHRQYTQSLNIPNQKQNHEELQEFTEDALKSFQNEREVLLEVRSTGQSFKSWICICITSCVLQKSRMKLR